MFRIHLVLSRTDSRWNFRLGRLFRAVNAAAGLLLMAAGMWLDALPVASGLAGVAFLGALYEESVRFDKARGRVEFRVGLVFWCRLRTWALAEVRAVKLTTFGAAPFTNLEVVRAEGQATIENDRGKPSAMRLEAWGRELAEWLEVPFERG